MKTPPGTRLRRWAKILLGREIAHRLDLHLPVRWHGSEYGGWWVWEEGLGHDHPIVYAFGIGEDISFEISLAGTLNRPEIHSFDPTPRSLQWLATQRKPPTMSVHPWALAARDGSLVLYPPANPDHVSHSVAGSGEGITVPARRLSSVQRDLGHRRVDLLKLDIEGAEYEVVNDLVGISRPPTQLLIEFHHGRHGFTNHDTLRAVEVLRRIGYRLIAVSPVGRELTFVNRDMLSHN